jgi:hypothetical protein
MDRAAWKATAFSGVLRIFFLNATIPVQIRFFRKAINPDMLRFSDLHACIVRLVQGCKLFQPSNSWIILGLSMILLFPITSCASTSRASYESQRRGLLMLEGENIYKNQGFYKSKKSYKHRKKVMKAHKKKSRGRRY